ncbi:hypothetical protein ACFOY4_39605 [Actinomadura syzygii]|uniref:Integral membrane protein n=1 Tax=Actinomadura syzygii TaxID=1427538 RepID=A0A5D0U801_9ACTN|nr:hypothetical protein [Actinomadura syzygii]TYC14468.1 hypothetical protein FXF65_16590 [Actinomadura syzygii]
MELILMVLLPLPLGYLVRNRTAAYLTYVGVHSFAFTFQTMTLTRAWVGGETRAFAKDPDSVPWSYAAVNVAIYAAGLGLVTLGAWLRSRRASTPGPKPVDISG